VTLPPLFLQRLVLTGFRSYRDLRLTLGDPVTLVLGPNGAGKTNLLEAVSMLVPGRGLRGAAPLDLAQRGGAGGWTVSGRFSTPFGPLDLGTGTEAKLPTRRRFQMDGTTVPGTEVARRVAVVWLTPQMDRLFLEGAGARRRFLDRLVYALEPAHAREVSAYETAMAGRNRLLAEASPDPAWLTALEATMARHGIAASAARRSLVKRLSETALAARLQPFPAVSVALDCPWAALLDERPARLAEQDLAHALAANRPRDRAAGAALSGPHRADFALGDLDRSLPAALCSTGEQKALLVAVVLAHAELIASLRGDCPVLLLDEVAAHLDEARREALFAMLLRLPAQALLTGTEEAPFAGLRGNAAALRIASGRLGPIQGWANAPVQE